jgi:hypothetical protein
VAARRPFSVYVAACAARNDLAHLSELMNLAQHESRPRGGETEQFEHYPQAVFTLPARVISELLKLRR